MEKQRYTNFACGCCVDNQDNSNIVNCIERLNQQDKHIKELQNQSVIKILKELNIELARNAYYSEDADDDVLDMYKLNLLFENKIKELEKKR